MTTMKTAFVKQVLDVVGPWSTVRWDDTAPLGLFERWPGRATLWEMSCLLKADWYIIPQQRDTGYTKAAVLDCPGRRELIMENVRDVVDVQDVPFDQYDLVVTNDPILDIPNLPRTLLAYYVAEHDDPLYAESLDGPIGNYDLFLDHMLNSAQTLERLPQALSMPYLRDPDTVSAVFGNCEKQESVWVDWRTLEALGLTQHDEQVVAAVCSSIEKRLGLPVRSKSDHLGILFGISDPPRWGDGADYLGRLAKSRYYVSVGGGRRAGQGLCDAASLGCICVGERNKAYHRILCHPVCLCDRMPEALDRLRRVMDSRQLQQEVLTWQSERLREYFVDRPLAIIGRALEIKRKASPVFTVESGGAVGVSTAAEHGGHGSHESWSRQAGTLTAGRSAESIEPEFTGLSLSEPAGSPGADPAAGCSAAIVSPPSFASRQCTPVPGTPAAPAANAGTRVVMTSGLLARYNGGTKIYNTWVKLLRSNGVDAVIATQDGRYEPWLVHHQPVISYAELNRCRAEGRDLRIVTTWLDTPGFQELVADGRFYYFDAELKWTLEFRPRLDAYFNKQRIAAVGTHSRYIQAWYMANYGIKPVLINEWSDESVFYEDAGARIPGRIGCMPDSSDRDREAFDFLAEKVSRYGRGAELVEIKGDEQQVAGVLRTVDIFVGLNAGKHPFWGEGCPRTQQEALHCGCVLVAYDCLGNREYLYDGWTGIIVPAGDPESLWEAVQRLLEQPRQKERLRANGKAIAAGLFSERNKFPLLCSFLGLDRQDGHKQQAPMTKDELSALLPGPFWLAEQEVPFLAQAAAQARGTIVEIGCAFGGSTTVFLLNKRDGVRVYSIDPFVPDSKGGVRADARLCRNTVAQALINRDMGCVFHDWQLIEAYSHEVAASWDRPIDLLFIDGSHDYEDVRRDFENWSRFLAYDGRILIHDSRKDNIAEDPLDQKFSRGWAGPTKLVEQLKTSSDFELVDTCYSISVFARKPTP